jgi:hypothetical protein
VPDAEKNSPGAPGGLWTAANVSRELGLAVVVVEGLRTAHCTAAGDLTTVRGQVVFTAAGLKKIQSAVAQGMSTTPAVVAQAPRRPTPAPSTLPTEDLTIARIFRGSPRVLANRPNGNEVVLQVKTAELLKPGMVLTDCQHGGMGWYYHGKLPRVIGEQQFYFPAEKPVAKGGKGKAA